ncbi:MAG: rRNA maturation RNase YbeY [Bacteroidales bacterium]|jgi:rRNA maturation RNase YbeY|nr:rRNA maturation RNase YbeY [Bacteroidales bacterium]MBQ3983338.1 rRNA maturation RNase YbeY [Bacteroidales bacterium]
MAIYFSSENIKFDLRGKLKVKKWITDLIKAQNKKVGDISYLFCDDAYLIEVNRTYLDHDTYTDIITFDYVEGDTISGDILISVERVKENAQLFNTTFDQELHRVIIHGVLHLLGQGDKTEAEAAQMRKKEEAALALWNTMN